jgi:hypothetical protein
MHLGQKYLRDQLIEKLEAMKDEAKPEVKEAIEKYLETKDSTRRMVLPLMPL